MKRLGELRIRLDVLSARLASIEGKVKEQTAALSVQGANVRRAFQCVVGRLFVSRDARVTETLVDLFASVCVGLDCSEGWEAIRNEHLARQTRLMKQVRDLDIKLSHPITDPEQETLALQTRTRTWLTEITDLVTNEPGLILRNVATEPQPIEEPARELATV